MIEITPENIQGYIALLGIAFALGKEAFEAVRDGLSKKMSQEDLQKVLGLWQENVARSAANAGIEQ